MAVLRYLCELWNRLSRRSVQPVCKTGFRLLQAECWALGRRCGILTECYRTHKLQYSASDLEPRLELGMQDKQLKLGLASPLVLG